MKPHIHADIIKAWADGATIEYFWEGKWKTTDMPVWEVTTRYRVKPKAKKLNVTIVLMRTTYNGEYYTVTAESHLELKDLAKSSEFVRVLEHREYEIKETDQ